jgi:hypothetical protein
MLALLSPQAWLGQSMGEAQSKREHGSRAPRKRNTNSEHEPKLTYFPCALTTAP